jgi:hypothetical protein
MDVMQKLREAKRDFISWWAKRLQLLRKMAARVRSTITAKIAIGQAERSVKRKTKQARKKPNR